MNEIPTTVLYVVLACLLVLSACFSGSETGIMSLNRYRLRHLAKKGQKGAILVQNLLKRPDRLLGVILLGNNFVNILASSITTIIALRLGGETALAVGAGLLTLCILIFAEVAPKTLAAIYPERIAFPAAYVYTVLLKVLYPIIFIVNLLANGVLKLFGVDTQHALATQALSQDELRMIVHEAGTLIPQRHQSMLLSILDLETVTIEDIMVPRNEIIGIDITDEWHEIVEKLTHSQHTRLPVYKHQIDEVVGMVHLRNTLHLLTENQLSRETLMGIISEPYFVPESTPLNTQLINFQRQEQRIGLVVDEYGDIRGLVTLEDILEEIVGEFTTDPMTTIRDVHPQEDGSYLVDGSANLRELNRMMKWSLPTDGPKTLNGIIIERLESIPEVGISIKISDYPIEVVQTSGNAVKTARIYAQLVTQPPTDLSSIDS